MRDSPRHLLLLALLLAQAGCVIGTWPTPEDRQGEESVDPIPSDDGYGRLGGNVCDGVDNDADGAIDEGCPCTDDVRACVGVSGDQCGLGIQRCVGGSWLECSQIGPPFTAAREPRLEIVDDVVPAALQINGGEGLLVRVAVQTRCASIVATHVSLTLESRTPVMRVRGEARDGGIPPDAVAGDGDYTGELVNPYGPGLAAPQPLTLTASALIDGARVQAQEIIPLEEAP